jgi:hypothetical protein
VFCFFHGKGFEYLNRTVNRINKPAAAFNENPDFPTGSPFLVAYGLYDAGFLLFGKKRNSFCERE